MTCPPRSQLPTSFGQTCPRVDSDLMRQPEPLEARRGLLGQAEGSEVVHAGSALPEQGRLSLHAKACSKKAEPRGQHAAIRRSSKCPRQESNLRTRIRNPVLYPLSYEGGTIRSVSASTSDSARSWTFPCKRAYSGKSIGLGNRCFIHRATGRLAQPCGLSRIYVLSTLEPTVPDLLS